MRIIRLLVLLFLGAVDVLLFVRETTVFRIMSYKWVIALYSILTFLLIVWYIWDLIADDEHFLIRLIGLIVIVLLLALMIVSMNIPRSVQTYTVSDAKDFKVLSNVPKINRYRILITDDVDMDGEELKLGKKFNNDIKGGGHTISNFSVENGIFEEFNGTADGITFANVKVKYSYEYEELNKTRDPAEVVLFATGSGVLRNVNVQNNEDAGVRYRSDGGGMPWYGYVIIVIILCGIGSAIYDEKIKK